MLFHFDCGRVPSLHNPRRTYITSAGSLDSPVFAFDFHKVRPNCYLSAAALNQLDQTRSGRAFSEWNADTGEPLHLPPAVNLDKLFEASLFERIALEEEGPLEDDPELEAAATATRPGVSPLAPPPPWHSPPPIFAGSLDAFPSMTAPAVGGTPRGAALLDGLTREQFHKQKHREKQRASRADARAKKQAEIGDSLKAAARRHRAGIFPVHADFVLEPQNVHIAKTGVIGKATKATAAGRKIISFKSAKKLGFTHVKWRGACVSACSSLHSSVADCVLRNSCALVDSNGRVFGSLSQGPNEPEWGGIIERAAIMCAWAQKELARGDGLQPPDHRRGPYWFATDGFSIGSGQQVRIFSLCPHTSGPTDAQRVGNFRLSRLHQRVLGVLKVNKDIIRIANFGSGESTAQTTTSARPHVRRMPAELRP